MYKDGTGREWKISITTPAGREKYLSIFKKYIYRDVKAGIVDEWQLWLNTVNINDIAYIESMAAENDKVKIFRLDEAITPTWESYNALQTHKFFKNSHDDNTIYIRFDDDIVWYEPGCIEKIAQARIDHPEAFAIYPNVINSTIVNSWHQKSGALGKEAGEVRQEKDDYKNDDDRNWAYLDAFNYTDSKFVDCIHDTFKKHYDEGTLSDYYLPSRSLDNFQRFSICSLAWWGKEHVAPGPSEEAQMSWELPKSNNRPNWLCGDALMVHYSYHTQRDYLVREGDKHLVFYKKLSDEIV
jgi:hypothetical protein